MSTRTLRITLAASGICMVLLLGAAALWAAADNEYPSADVTIKEVKALEDGKIEIVFSTKQEGLYYCPGANGKTTDKGTELIFVRASIKEKPEVTYPAQRVKLQKVNEAFMYIVVDAKGKPVFLRSGDKATKIYPKE